MHALSSLYGRQANPQAYRGIAVLLNAVTVYASCTKLHVLTPYMSLGPQAFDCWAPEAYKVDHQPQPQG